MENKYNQFRWNLTLWNTVRCMEAVGGDESSVVKKQSQLKGQLLSINLIITRNANVFRITLFMLMITFCVWLSFVRTYWYDHCKCYRLPGNRIVTMSFTNMALSRRNKESLLFTWSNRLPVPYSWSEWWGLIDHWTVISLYLISARFVLSSQ